MAAFERLRGKWFKVQFTVKFLKAWIDDCLASVVSDDMVIIKEADEMAGTDEERLAKVTSLTTVKYTGG